MKINLPETGQERIVIVGGGFAGLTLARKLAKSQYQVVLIDKNNYHQFQPLFYQVAMAGLEPSSIIFPYRKLFQHHKNVFIRMTEVNAVDLNKKQLQTPYGIVNYDHLILSMGVDTNFFGNQQIAELAMPLKDVSEALLLRNKILEDYEKALVITDFEERQRYIDIVIVGGGPTGVEVAGALAEMKQFILPKDYPEMDISEIDIYLIQSGPRLLKGMSEEAADKALKFLTQLGVKVQLNTRVKDFDGKYAYMNDGTKICTSKVIWAAGIKGNTIEGLPADAICRGNRLLVDELHQVKGVENVYALGDLAQMESEEYPHGHPQVAQVAIQQAKNLAANFKRKAKSKEVRAFRYKNRGSMATVGRHRAVVDLPKFRFQGTFAWLVWMVVHLFAILGVKNKLFVFINWVWNYLTYDQSLRLILRAKTPRNIDQQTENTSSSAKE